MLSAMPAPIWSLVIPAFNEEAFLPATLDRAFAALVACPLPGEVVVVDNNSTDRTAAIARERGCRVVHESINGIARARNAGAAVARGRFLIFLDADTVLEASLLNRALAILVSGRCCGGGVTLRFDVPQDPLARLSTAIWELVQRSNHWASGCFIFCRADAFRAVGGFDPQVLISEEIGLSRRLSRWGQRHGQDFRILDGRPIISSGRKLKWVTPRYVVLTCLAMLFFPVGIRSRRLCAFWYERPWQEGA